MVTPDCRCRYLCERCGGNGMQEDGCYDASTNSYTGKSGKCQTCDGTGYLGYLERENAGLRNVPKLPSEWQPPFQWGCIPTHIHDETLECLYDSASRCMMFDCGGQTGKFIAALLNAVYPLTPAPNQEAKT